MSEIRLTKTVLKAGVWHGRAMRTDGAETPEPRLSAWYLDQALAAPEVASSKEPGLWDVKLVLPPELLSDGVQTVLIRDEASGETVEKLTLVAGDPLDHDLRAEVSLLRAELDLLKRAFRRHCVDGEC